MATARPVMVLNQALSQRDRVLNAPDAEAVKADGRGLAQLIAFAADYGALIRFYDLSDEPDGEWAAFFGADESVALALHAALDLPRIEGDCRRLLRMARDRRHGHDRRRHFRQVLAVIGRLLSLLERHRPAADERGRSDAAGPSLAALYAHLGEEALEEALDDAFEARAEHWRERLADILEDVVNAVIGELQRGAAAADAALKVSLGADGHAPQAALWNAFAMLFDKARGRLNQFAQRLLDFYYGDLLKQNSVAARPDRVFLTFTTASGFDAAAIPKGTLFLAGKDADGVDINYAAETPLEVRATSIKSLSIHRTAQDGSADDPQTAVLTGRVDLQALMSGQAAPFPLFGLESVDVAGALTMGPASLGFVVSSQTLMLQGGARSVQLTLDLDPASVAQAVAQIKASPTPQAGGEDPAVTLAGIARSNFELLYSTAGGWMVVPDYTVTVVPATTSTAASAFNLVFNLASNAPPLVTVSTKAAAGAPPPTCPADSYPNPGYPSILVKWSPPAAAPTSGPDAFAVISRIKMTSLRLTVSVTDLTGLTITTPSGPADPSQPMILFGAAPTQYAEVDVAAPELFVKSMDRLSVNIHWAGLPVTTTGFKGYYQGYMLDADGAVASKPLFDNAMFLVRMSVGAPGGAAGPVTADADADADPGAPWTVNPNTTLNLFQSGPAATSVPDGPVNPTTVLDAPQVAHCNQGPFFDPMACALRITLESPPYAFGNVIYANNLIHASLLQAKAPAPRGPGIWPRQTPPPPIPNAPWVPTASGVSVSYAASTDVSLAVLVDKSLEAAGTDAPPAPAAPPVTTDFLHLGAFKPTQTLTALPPSDMSLLPEVKALAALYLELSAPVGEISLLFNLAPTQRGATSQASVVAWDQWIAGSWRAAAVIADSTEGLTSTGIVRLKLGLGKEAESTAWLRVRAVRWVDNAPLVKAVAVNALTAAWVPPGGAAARGTPLPAGSIAAVPPTLPGIATLDQPMDSVGGSPLATGAAFEMWMAERLRHKGFAVDAWDYAHLVLEQTPSIWQAAVIPATDPTTGSAAPGQVWIVVVGGPNTPNVTDPTAPLVSPSVLDEVCSTISATASPFARIAVTNPRYVRVTVSAVLTFRGLNTDDTYIAMLQTELVKWLSPWPDATLGPRPSVYYTRHAVGEFIRGRSYVAGVSKLKISYDPDLGEGGPGYLTSALGHDLKTPPPGGRDLPARAAVPGGALS